MRKLVSVVLLCFITIGVVSSAIAMHARSQLGGCTTTVQFGGGVGIRCVGSCPVGVVCKKVTESYEGGGLI